ncbi:uncharacterized protein LOC135112996 [Scylla paramamosain]|uniref:uncharacterized protein LOC135112996 n=1 Tax=Scylla paramamosain TaxID=85552 RepID=UPI0030830D52
MWTSAVLVLVVMLGAREVGSDKVLLGSLGRQVSPQTADKEFTPNIQASCKTGYMQINVNVKDPPFVGAVHSRDFRKEGCMVVGDGSSHVTLSLPLITDESDPNYCGVRVNKTSKEKYVPIAVRMHETLELANDKFYIIKCGLPGFFNARNESSFITLQLLDQDKKKVKEAVFDRRYILRADISQPDNTHSMRIKDCFSFGEPNYTVPLTDDRGCPEGSLISPFVYNETAGTAEAVLNRMFRFPTTNRVHFQCDVLICKGPCEIEQCAGKSERLTVVQGRALPATDANSVEEKGGRVQATTTVYVVEPTTIGERTLSLFHLSLSLLPAQGREIRHTHASPVSDWPDGVRVVPPWLWILCIVLAVLFVIMMIINIFLCSAMTCSCTKSEVIEKEPSIIEEYDPYRSWHGSQYGSRYSLNGKGYTSGASTLNSARSVSSHSDHYVAVHSRPNSRYSGHHSLKHERPHHHHHHHSRGPPPPPAAITPGNIKWSGVKERVER